MSDTVLNKKIDVVCDRISRACDSFDGAAEAFDKTRGSVETMRASLVAERETECGVLRLAINNSVAQDARHREDMKMMMSALSETQKSVAETNATIAKMAAEFHLALGEVKTMTKCVGNAVDGIKVDKREIFDRLNRAEQLLAALNAIITANKELAGVKIDSVKDHENLRDSGAWKTWLVVSAVAGSLITIIVSLAKPN